MQQVQRGRSYELAILEVLRLSPDKPWHKWSPVEQASWHHKAQSHLECDDHGMGMHATTWTPMITAKLCIELWQDTALRIHYSKWLQRTEKQDSRTWICSNDRVRQRVSNVLCWELPLQIPILKRLTSSNKLLEEGSEYLNLNERTAPLKWASNLAPKSRVVLRRGIWFTFIWQLYIFQRLRHYSSMP